MAKMKKIFFDFFPIGGHPSGGDRIILGQKLQKNIFAFFHELNHSDAKNENIFFIFAHWG